HGARRTSKPTRPGSSAATPKGVSSHVSEFPVADALWCRFFDDRLPYWVKRKYTPRHFDKDPRFNESDAKFYAGQVARLSEFFTRRAPEAEASAYFEEANTRTAYLLYYVPLQAAKFT